MKTTLLILTLITTLLGCKKENLNSEKLATVYYQWVDIGWADARCTYIIEINDNYYCTGNLKIEHKSTNPINVELTFNKTTQNASCTSALWKGKGALKIPVIEISSIKIRN